MVFVYDGTAYAPVRALAEAYGLQVGYDSEKNLATVSQPEVDNTSGEVDDTPEVNITTEPEPKSVNLGGYEVEVVTYNGKEYISTGRIRDIWAMRGGIVGSRDGEIPEVDEWNIYRGDLWGTQTLAFNDDFSIISFIRSISDTPEFRWWADPELYVVVGVMNFEDPVHVFIVDSRHTELSYVIDNFAHLFTD